MFPRVTPPSVVRSRRLRLRVAGAALAVTALVSAGACSSDGSTTAGTTSSAASTTSRHNAADVTFTRDMIPHHRQAVEMAQLAPDRSADPRVTALAAQIAAGQGPEIDELVGRLRSWGEAVPDDSATDHAAMGHGGTSMAGMMSASDMAELAGLRGADFDRTWVTMMIEHHTGAISMARTELADGSDPESTALATRIIDAQQAEIARMRTIQAG